MSLEICQRCRGRLLAIEDHHASPHLGGVVEFVLMRLVVGRDVLVGNIFGRKLILEEGAHHLLDHRPIARADHRWILVDAAAFRFLRQKLEAD